MAQMSDKCLLFKTEKAQISGQMQIICACWDLWLDLKVVQLKMRFSEQIDTPV